MTRVNAQPLIPRTTSTLSSESLLARIRQTQREQFEVQRQIATGKRFNTPSDAPDKASAILYLQGNLDERSQQQRNLANALGTLNTADLALADASDILLEAKDIASSQIGVGSDSGTRETEALVIDGAVDGLLEIVNRQFNDLSIFGGNNGAEADGVVFEKFLGGVRYRGGEENLKALVGAIAAEDFNSNGIEGFGALSSRVRSDVDLLPASTAATRVADVLGAQGDGVGLGEVRVTVNGTPVTVDLTDADTLDDVATRINAAIDGVSAGAASLAITATGYDLTVAGGNTVTVADIGAGQVAADLGIALGGAGPVVDSGAGLNVRLSPTTTLASLGATADFASGLQITQGQNTVTADFSAATTIEDMQNVIDQLGLGLRLRINESKTGLDLVSEVAGLELSVGENGGTTAEDLGLRTFGLTTDLTEFRHGVGVEVQDGEDDLRVSLHDGTSFTVNLDGAATVGDVITAINTAATGAGLTVGVDFTVGLAAVGNGLVFDDNTAGGNDFVIANEGLSLAGDHLGITGNAGAGTTLTGSDETTVRVENAFTHLINLRDTLRADDTPGITLAGSNLEDDLDSVVAARAGVGVQARRIEDQQTRLEDQQIAEQTMLSEIQDADLTEVITRFGQLQTQLQASLSLAAQNLQLSLLDFIG